MIDDSKEFLELAMKELSPSYIVWEQLQSYPEYTRNDYLFCRMKDILAAINERIRDIAQSVIGVGGLDGLDDCPGKYEAVAGDRYYDSWLRDAGKNSLRKKIYTITFTGLRVCKKGCHEILFGTSTPVRLTSTEELVLRLMRNCQPNHLKEYLEFLDDNRQYSDCPWYIMQQRFIEVLDEQCIPASSGCQFATVENYTQMRQMKMMHSVLFEKSLSPWHEENIEKVPQLKPASWRGLALCMLICSAYNISADRLLVQDFSDFAVHSNGTPISYHERIILSRYLSASERAKKQLLSKLVADGIVQHSI